MTNSICLPGECRGHFFEVVSDIENYPCFPSCFYFFHLCTGISNRLDFRFNQVLCVIKFSPSQLYLQFPIVEINNFATVRYKLFAIKQIKQLPQKLISKSAISEPSTVIFSAVLLLCDSLYFQSSHQTKRGQCSQTVLFWSGL